MKTTTHRDFFLVSRPPLNRRRPTTRPAVKYAAAAYLVSALVIAGIFILINALFR